MNRLIIFYSKCKSIFTNNSTIFFYFTLLPFMYVFYCCYPYPCCAPGPMFPPVVTHFLSQFLYFLGGGFCVLYMYLCRPSEASTRYCVIPGGYPPQDWQSLPCTGEELDLNPGLLICSQSAESAIPMLSFSAGCRVIGCPIDSKRDTNRIQLRVTGRSPSHILMALYLHVSKYMHHELFVHYCYCSAVFIMRLGVAC